MPIVLNVMECATGGAPIQLVEEMRAVPHVDQAVLWPAINDELASGLDVDLYEMPSGRRAQAGAVRAILRAFSHADLVVAHSSFAGMFVRAQPQRLPAPVIFEPHGWSFTNPVFSPKARRVYRALEKAMVPRTAAVMAASTFDVQTARDLGHRNVHQVVVPSRATSLIGRDESPLVVTVGRVTPVKGPDFFAQVARLVRAKNPDIRFRWVGAGRDDLTMDLLDAGVEVTGWVSEQEAWEHQAQAHLHIHTSVWEGFSRVVLDAGWLGTPMALRDIPMFADVPGERIRTPAQMADTVLATIAGRLEWPTTASAYVHDMSDAARFADTMAAIYGTTP